MYTFQPLASIQVDHVGFFLICFISVIALCVCLMNEPEAFFVWFFFGAVACGIAYGVSYHWTNQAELHYPNVKVTAEFAGYAPEGYREKSGKSYVDRHYVYVVYTVNGNPVLMQGSAGVEYPKTAILYKN